jgi:hypothetical protein
MDKNHSEYLEISFPRWFRICLAFCGIFTILLFAFYIVWVAYNGQLASRLLRCAIFTSVIVGIVWFFLKILFYSVTATDRGLEADNIVGANKVFLWDEIVEVRRPRFGIPHDATYVISRNNGKLLLVRSMKNYKEFIQLIKDRAANLQNFHFDTGPK